MIALDKWRHLFAKPVAADPFGLVAALEARRAARPARQEAAKRAAETRRERRA